MQQDLGGGGGGPLRAIQGFSRMLEEGHSAQLDEEGRRLLGVVGTNARTMSQLIRDLLEFSRLGRQHVHSAEVDMQALVQQVVEGLRQNPDGLRARIEVDALPDAFGDRALLRQVWANLLSNAAKFSPAGERVRVTATLQGRSVRVAVLDRGPGVPEQFQPRLFQKFSQADASDSRAKGGTGLGLAITKAIVERMGGRIGFESKPGTGATFFFELPCAPLPEPPPG